MTTLSQQSQNPLFSAGKAEEAVRRRRRRASATIKFFFSEY